MGVPKKLTEMQIKFAQLLVTNEGRKTPTECAIEAGYNKDRATITASELQSPKRYPLVVKYIGEIREDIEANIGALVTTPSGNVYHGAAIGEGWGKLSGSIDEFRFWKTRRTEKQIKRNYFTNQIGGGTNPDTANLDLGVYY